MRIAHFSWSSVAPSTRTARAGRDPEHRHRDEAGDQHQRAGGGQPVEVERRLLSGSPSGFATSRPGQWNVRGPGDSASTSLTAGICAIEKHRDDDHVGRVGAHDVARRVAAACRRGARPRAPSPGRAPRRPPRPAARSVRSRASPSSGSPGCPDAQEADDAGGREQRGDDVGELDREVVRAGRTGRGRRRGRRRRPPARSGGCRAGRRPCRSGSAARTGRGTASGVRPSRRGRPCRAR